MARHMTVHKTAGDGMVHKDELKRLRRKNRCGPIGLIHRTILPASVLCGTILLNAATKLHGSNSIPAQAQRCYEGSSVLPAFLQPRSIAAENDA
jgi:hypothetical protein